MTLNEWMEKKKKKKCFFLVQTYDMTTFLPHLKQEEWNTLPFVLCLRKPTIPKMSLASNGPLSAEHGNLSFESRTNTYVHN
jgi:hypothetical protein